MSSVARSINLCQLTMIVDYYFSILLFETAAYDVARLQLNSFVLATVSFVKQLNCAISVGKCNRWNKSIAPDRSFQKRKRFEICLFDQRAMRLFVWQFAKIKSLIILLNYLVITAFLFSPCHTNRCGHMKLIHESGTWNRFEL